MSQPARYGAASSRRPHKKVRTGCVNCKKRKIKCDEHKPECNNCIKHSVTCDFSNTSHESGSPIIAAFCTPNTELSTGTSASPNTVPLLNLAENVELVDSPLNLNTVHLELLHNFTTSTSYTLSGDAALRTLWRVNVPQIGFTHSFVLRAILAISALHLSRLSPQRRHKYLSTAKCEHEIALRTATPMFSEITPDNCSALYIFSVLTFFYAWASPRTAGDILLVSDTGVASWMALLRGVRSVVEASENDLRAGPLGPMFHAGLMRVEQVGKQSRYSTSWLATTEHRQLAELLQQLSTTLADSHLIQVYAKSIEVLEICFCSCYCAPTVSYPVLQIDLDSGFYSHDASRPPSTSDIYAWLYKLSPEYLQLLAQRTPEALVIFAHFCVLLKTLDGCWWMQGWPAHLLQTIWNLLGEHHRLWIRWPMEEVGWRPERGDEYK